MKKVKYLYTLLAGILMLAAISCKKDFMDRYPQTSVPPDGAAMLVIRVPMIKQPPLQWRLNP